MKTTKRYLCPKCGERYMTKGSRTPGGKIRWCCRDPKRGEGRLLCYQTTNPNAPYRGANPNIALEFPGEVKKQTLVITWAQNATPIHKPFFNALLGYCKHNDAQLIVMPGRYKNPTSFWPESQANEQWWNKALAPYLINKRVELNKNLVFLGDVRVQPTAVTPLTGFEGLTLDEGGILGHPKLQMTVIPAPHQKLPKILTTTGAVTIENYTDTKAGKKGEFHHVIGAVVVELEGNFYHLRHINARKDGAFCDLTKAYFANGKVKDAGPYEALVPGDVHVEFTDPAVEFATYGRNGLVERLDPKRLVFHDLLDNYAVNPYHAKKPFIQVAKQKMMRNNVRREIERACEWVIEKTGKRLGYVVGSNHNDFLSRWMDSQDWRDDPKNAQTYLETALEMVRSATIGPRGAEVPDPFKLWFRLFVKAKNIVCLGRSESLMIAGIECSLHGDQGPNGARGSRANLSKIGAKTVIGHSHTPGITNGCYQAGTSTPLSLEYTGAVGSWLQSHVSIDPMGKRHIHTLINGKFWR